MAGFKDIKLMGIFEGESLLDISDKLYGKVVPLSQRINILVIGINANSLASAAHGLFFLNDDTIVRLLLVHRAEEHLSSSDDWKDKANAYLDNIPQTIEADLEQPQFSRQREFIKLLAWLIKTKNVRIYCISSTDEIDPSIEAECGSTSAATLFIDAQGQIVFCRQNSSEVKNSVRVKWNWGDPEETVNKLHEKLEVTFLNSPNENELCDKILEGLLSYCPASKPETNPAEYPEGQSVEPFLKLWPHQEKAVHNWVINEHRGIFEMCTGAGKTIAAIHCIKRLEDLSRDSNKKMGTVVVACPTRVLVEQWNSELKKHGFTRVLEAYESVNQYIDKLALYLDSTKRKDGTWVVVTTYKTLSESAFASKIKLTSSRSEPALLIADEMHNLGSTHSRRMLREYERYFNFRIGLSATPEIEGNASGTKELMNYFSGVVIQYGLEQAIRENILCPYDYYPWPKLIEEDLSKEYTKILDKIDDESGVDLFRQKRQIMLRSRAFLACLNEVIEKTLAENKNSKLTLVFAPPGFDRTNSSEDNDEKRLLAMAKRILEDHDLLCGTIIAETPSALRPEILKDFEKGEFDVLLSIGCLDEGMDIPCVRRAIMLYSYDRLKQFIQRRGRVLRKYYNKEKALIYDLILLPHKMGWPKSRMEALINKEMRRYAAFAQMAQNRAEAEFLLEQGMSLALGGNIDANY